MVAEWEDLLARSSQDRLFMGWEWQYLWWKEWSEPLNLELLLLAAYSGDNRLIGLAPLYLYNGKVFSYIPARQIHFIGCTWGLIESVRTEYIDFVIDNDYKEQLRERFLNYLNENVVWDQFIISDIYTESLTVRYILKNKIFANSYVRIVQEDKTTCIETNENFQSYTNGLGKNTRYKMVNRRNYLLKQEELDISKADKTDIDTYFDQMNELHCARWTTPCFSGHSLSFHRQLAKVLYDRKALNISRITVKGTPISLLYNLIVGSREYNIQSAFDENFKKNYSLGLVHLGISIEEAFLKTDINHFDLLAGGGKNEKFKSHVGKAGIPLISLQILKNWKLKYIYMLYDHTPRAIRNILRKIISRLF